MATTEIHAITTTVEQAIAYIMNDKVEGYLRERVPHTVNYSIDKSTGNVTYKTLTATQNCANPSDPSRDFSYFASFFGRRELVYGCTRAKGGKPILAWHLIQSFEGEVDPRLANKIGKELVEQIFGEHPAVISTHTNKENTHNHIVVCAWNLDGKKWNNCHKSYQSIRSCSDMLCEKYGLSVLDKTREQKLIRWTDKAGRVRYFEPTDRKIDLIRDREASRASSADVRSYCNTLSCDISVKEKELHIQIVKQAIDETLPYARSYEQLLDLLRNQGFTVKDKRKNGEWHRNITFIAPSAAKGIRDSSLDREGSRYTRKKLSALIAAQNLERERSEQLQEKLNLPVYEEYDYGAVDVQSINESYRAYYAQDSSIRISERKVPEKDIIWDIKQMDRLLYGLFDTARLHQLIEEQRKARKKNVPPHNREERLIRQIQENFEALRFVENRRFYSCQQIDESIRKLRQELNICENEIKKAEMKIGELQKKDPSADVEEYQDRLDWLREEQKNIAMEVSAHEHCMKALDRINAEKDRKAEPSKESTAASRKKAERER